eukprot:s3721_g8.t1
MASSLDDGLPSDTEPVAIETAPSKPKPKRKAKAARETGKRKVCTETKGDKSKKKEKKDSRPAMNECCDEHVGQPVLPHSDLVPDEMAMVPRDLSGCDLLWEIYSPPRLINILADKGYSHSRAYDLKTGWNLLFEREQRSLVQDQYKHRPFFVHACPPCTHLSSLSNSNWTRGDFQKRLRDLKEGLHHVDVTAWVAQIQKETGGFYSLEHPSVSQMWRRSCVARQVKVEC